MSEQKRPTKIAGANEWADSNGSCYYGCVNGCKYCYAAHYAVQRHLPVNYPCPSHEAFTTTYVKPRKNALTSPRTIKPAPGKLHMFPLMHDIWPENLDYCLAYIKRHVSAGNRVLLVSKPRFACITKLVSEFRQHADRILFRFTIGANNSRILRYWEPNAPSYEERRRCLRYAVDMGMQTSVGCTPVLDISRAVSLYNELLPAVTETFWFGYMRGEHRIQDDVSDLRKRAILLEHNNAAFMQLYTTLKDEPQVRFISDLREFGEAGIIAEPQTA